MIEINTSLYTPLPGKEEKAILTTLFPETISGKYAVALVEYNLYIYLDT